MTQRILAIETSNPSAGPGAGVAVGEASPDGSMRVLAVERLAGQSRHDDELVALIDSAMRRAGWQPRDLHRVAVSIGPGGYTALRIAVSAANLIAYATGAGLIAIPTARVAAHAARDLPRPMLVLLASSRDSAHVTRFTAYDAMGDAIGVLTGEELLALRPATILADAHAPTSVMAGAAEIGAKIVAPDLTPEACLAVAARTPQSDAAMVLPIYPRQPQAVIQWSKRAGV